MKKLGIITLGLTPDGEYLNNFLSSLGKTLSDEWNSIKGVHDYKHINPAELMDYDALVLSPGTAKVGLPQTRAEIDPHVLNLYNLIQNAANENIPILGINAGHMAINNAYNWAIDRVPDSEKEKYQSAHEITVSSLPYPVFEGIDKLAFQLSNTYAVLPEKKQKRRPGQKRVIQLLAFMDTVLVSGIDSAAPIYSAQFNIEDGTQKFFENYFRLASEYSGDN
ncbi:hypothetical protein GF323_03695 [Candidatus Woesearchaeota archaeon]|nr:hypothetical protein [Candidatus Woesearchaeota archaeon]